jgi:hypothetical protein
MSSGLGKQKGIIMDCQTEMLLAKLQEKVRLRHQDAAAGRSSSQSLIPQIKMIVGDWYIDELGNQARIIKAHD